MAAQIATTVYGREAALTEKFGGDSVAEIRRNIASYLESIPEVRR